MVRGGDVESVQFVFCDNKSPTAPGDRISVRQPNCRMSYGASRVASLVAAHPPDLRLLRIGKN